MGDDNNDTCSGGYGDSDDGCDDSEEDSADGYSSDNSYSSADDGDSYGFDSDYGDYSSDSYVSDDAAADEMDFSDITSGWGAVGNDATDTFSDFCDEVMAEGEAAYNDFANTVESALNTISNTFSSIKSSLTDTPEDTDSQTATNTPEQSSYMDRYDPEGYLAESNNPDDAISPDSRGILAMAVDAIADGITQRQQEITEELPDYVNAVNDAQNTSSYLSDLGNPDENTYTPNPDDELAPDSKGFIPTACEALALGAGAIANHINHPSPALQQAAQEMKDRADNGKLSSYAEDAYSYEKEENYAGYEEGRKNSEARLDAVIGAINTIRGNSLAKNTTTTAADTALSEKHVFTNASMTPIKEAGIKDIAGFAKYAAISSKAVAKNSVVAIGVGAMDIYDDFTNPNYTTSEKFTAAGIDAAGIIATVLGGVCIGALISFVGLTGAPAIAVAAGGSIIVGMKTDKVTSQKKEAVLGND